MTKTFTPRTIDRPLPPGAEWLKKPRAPKWRPLILEALEDGKAKLAHDIVLHIHDNYKVVIPESSYRTYINMLAKEGIIDIVNGTPFTGSIYLKKSNPKTVAKKKVAAKKR